MTYVCENCGFLFRRIGAVERCPYCGGSCLRPANAEEKKQLEQKIAAEK